MPISDPRDRFFYPHHTPMKDTYFPILIILDIQSSLDISHTVILKCLLISKNMMDGWINDLRFYVLFNSISVISGRCLDYTERLCAVELRLRLRRFHLE